MNKKVEAKLRQNGGLREQRLVVIVQVGLEKRNIYVKKLSESQGCKECELMWHLCLTGYRGG